MGSFEIIYHRLKSPYVFFDVGGEKIMIKERQGRLGRIYKRRQSIEIGIFYKILIAFAGILQPVVKGIAE